VGLISGSPINDKQHSGLMASWKQARPLFTAQTIGKIHQSRLRSSFENHSGIAVVMQRRLTHTHHGESLLFAPLPHSDNSEIANRSSAEAIADGPYGQKHQRPHQEQAGLALDQTERGTSGRHPCQQDS
jgi:hypothetical protein